MRKKLLLVFVSLVCFLPLAAQTSYVSSAADLALLASQVASTDGLAGQTIVLTADIDLTGTTWTPIGTAANPFKGTFDGNGHLIKGLHLFDATDGVGLFGYVAQEGVIKHLGIGNGTLVAKNKRRIGAIAGVCAGQVNECWSMAYIAAAGNIVGGLVGELRATGTMTDCYHAGMILNANDTIGGLVGRNYGTLTRVYNTGYAKNGKAIAGLDAEGHYADCFFDRKLYYMQSGVEDNEEVEAFDITPNMFALFTGYAAWSVADYRYPILSAFSSTDAAELSAAPLFIDITSADPINHANDLTVDFTVSTEKGVTWACQDARDEAWIQISGGEVKVIRPCTETEVIVNATLHAEQRVVYLRPRRLEDFSAGVFTNINYPTAFCMDDEAPIGSFVQMESAKNGWPEGDYFYCLLRFEVIGSDTVFVDTLFAANETAYESWKTEYKLDTSKPGLFVIRRLAHDEGCVQEWLPSKGEFVYRVFEPFNAGEITDGRDTVILNPNPYNTIVPSITDASGGGGPISYLWLLNGNSIPGSDAASLNYPITSSGVYTFTRTARDSAGCCGDHTLADGSFTRVVFDPFDPGEIADLADIYYCSLSEAKTQSVLAISATGGSGKYLYQWYVVDGSDTVAIDGATGKDLEIRLLSPKTGETYTVVRKAKDDTRFTTWTLSREKSTIHVMSSVNAGAIDGGALPDACVSYSAGLGTTLTVNVSEAVPATGDPAMKYRWIRNPGNTVIAMTRELSYTFPISDIILGTTYTYTREVCNPTCEWVPSDGAATQYYGRSTFAEVTITICDEQLPYTMTWIDGSSHTFTDSKDTWLVSDTHGRCPADTLFGLHVTSVPTFNIDDEASFCQSTGTMTLNFEQTEGNASNIFHVTYSEDLAKYMGSNDTTGLITIPGTIVFRNMPNIGTGDCYLNVQIGYAENPDAGVCFSRSHKMTLDVSLGGYVYSKYDRVLFVDNNPDNGALDGVTNKLEFKAYQWYRNGVKQEGQTEQYYHEDGNELNGVYHVILTDTKGAQYRSCDVIMPSGSSAAAPQRSAVYPVPVATNQALTIRCEGNAVIRSYAGEIVGQIDAIEDCAVINAPRMAGIYFIQITSPDGVVEMHKIIVK